MEIRKIAYISAFMFFMILLSTTYAYSQSRFSKTRECIENKQGWKQYCDDELSPEAETKTPIIKNQNQQEEQYTYTQKLSNFQKQLDEVKARAVLEPTEQNLKEYMILQMQTMNQASLFSDVWRRMVWVSPDLDYTQKRPTSNLGKEVWASDRENRTLDTLKNINKRYGIFFIYSTTCQYCIKYSQILKDLQQTYRIEIKGISIDGKFLQDWERDSFANNGQLEQLGIDYRTVPITVLFDNINQTIIPVGYGLMTHDEIMERIYVITQTTPGEDY